jgi:hypothetical protein
MKSGEDTPLEQIRVCAEICIRCLESDPQKRPEIRHIIEALNETESVMPDRQSIAEMHNDTESMDESIEAGTMSTLLVGNSCSSHTTVSFLEIMLQIDG